MIDFELHPVGVVHSPLRERKEAPRQGSEGAPEAWIEVDARFAEALDGITPGSEIILLTWLHLARRETLKVVPRRYPGATQLFGVFATRSPDRPNPIGVHRVTVLEVDPQRGLRVHPLEALDGTPVVDIKPVLPEVREQ